MVCFCRKEERSFRTVKKSEPLAGDRVLWERILSCFPEAIYGRRNGEVVPPYFGSRGGKGERRENATGADTLGVFYLWRRSMRCRRS